MSIGTGIEFLRKTTYGVQKSPDQQRGIPQPPSEAEYDGSSLFIDLLAPSDIKVKNINLRECIEKRRSIRNYSEDFLSQNELSWLLWCTQGIRNDSERSITLRNVPSAGARHAFETYLLINRVEGLKPGLFRYIATKHKLLKIATTEGFADKAVSAAYNQNMVKKSAVTFIWVAVPYRMTWRYGERGYRYLLLDAGHVCQNLYLAAENISSGVCAIAAYHDKMFNELLGLDGEEQFVIYLATLGKMK
jgi:SagB-type dehydrogenase family enzyme